MGTHAGEKTANILINPKEKSQVKKQLFTASLFLCSSFFAMPVAAEPLCTDISLVAVYEPEKPEIQKEAGYAVVNLNIRKEPDKNSEIIGKYQKGENVNIISDDGMWAKTDKGYVWGGYLSKEYKYNLPVRSDSENASRYVGFVYDKFNELNEKYINILKKYDICVTDSPQMSYKGDVKSDNGRLIDGLTCVGSNIHEMYLRADQNALETSVVHELGHAIDFETFDQGKFYSDDPVVTDSYNAELPALKEKYDLQDANTDNNMEYFAEAFRLSLEDPEGLAETAPKIAAYMEQVKNSL